jgi:hypothetical protein
MMDVIKSNVKVWLDDCSLQRRLKMTYLQLATSFSSNIRSMEKLHASKCVLFANKVKNCETLITKDGVRFDANNMKELQTISEQ